MSANLNGIAIVGMAGRFPKARDVAEFWKNICNSTEAISFFSDQELDPEAGELAGRNPRYVKARGLLEAADMFDAAFFGINPKEAEIMDPQHRLFLECCWEALENAGYNSHKFNGAIGVFGGMSMNTYLAHNLRGQEELIAQVGEYQLMLANDKDFLTTRVSYKLNLKGPSLNIQTACSTSLVAVCVACQNLLNYECDMAMAGAVSVTFPQRKGSLYQEGGIVSPDGHCRAFDAKAAGTVAGEGVGVVVLKRLEDAIAAGDMVYAVIKGFGINNDGSLKVGYTAPSVEGQSEAIEMAQTMAGFPPETISYVEAHGTGTPLGDPIEIEGLTRAFRSGTDAKKFCGIGSVKSNIGHLDTAAGVAGLIKTALALHHKKLPPTLHFELANPKIDFTNSPFYVNDKLKDWKSEGSPRRAGVSSFGIGGTNAHLVLEEAPAMERLEARTKEPVLLTLSARTATALEQMKRNLASHLREHSEMNLADLAYTLQMGRGEFPHRWAGICGDITGAISALASNENNGSIWNRVVSQGNAPVVFMFPGQGAQHINMGRELYDQGGAFREALDQCCDVLKGQLAMDLRDVLFPEAEFADKARELLTQTAITQPALFVVEYALARHWMKWGIRPQAMIGHSIGEYVAACLAGVFSLEEALNLVAVRGRMMQELPPGSMLAIRVNEEEARKILAADLSLAAVNSAALCVVSGNHEAIEALQQQLAARGTACTRLQTSHAFHSSMMEPILKSFAEAVARTKRNAPQIAFVSNVTGTWIREEEAMNPEYWAKHLRQTVRCAEGLGELFGDESRVFLEVGPGQTMTSLARQHPSRKSKTEVVPSLGGAKEPGSAGQAVLKAVAQLWLAGGTIDWAQLHDQRKRCRVPLPTYPFERKRFWVEPLPRRDQGSGNDAKHRSPLNPAVTVDANVMVPSQARESFESEPKEARGTIARLQKIFGELSGRDLSEVNPRATFIEMGFDSLFLTQASITLEKKLNVRVAFRDLLESLSSFELLAAHLDQVCELPAALAMAVEEQQSGGSGISAIQPRSRQSRAEQLLERLDDLSDSEVEALLRQENFKETLS